MFVAPNYKSKAVYIDTPSTLDFFIGSGKEALAKFSQQRKTPKDKTPIAIATTITDFDPATDQTIARAEINQRNPKRDFIEIDWDVDDKDKLDKVQEKLVEFAEEHDTIIFYYPSFSYPDKQRGRSIFFTTEPIGERSYHQAVKFLLNYIGVDNGDDQSFHIKSTFNLPVVNNRQQKDAMRTITPSGKTLSELNYLSPKLWANTKVPRNVGKVTELHDHDIMESEMRPRTDDYVRKVMPIIAERFQIRKSTNQQFDLERYHSFFQFLHAVARAEVLGGITREGADLIVEAVAENNQRWIKNNQRDYRIEFDRVANDASKLMKARPLHYYIGEHW